MMLSSKHRLMTFDLDCYIIFCVVAGHDIMSNISTKTKAHKPGPGLELLGFYT